MPAVKHRAVFLDRDGTLIQELGHIGHIKQVKFIKGVFTALRQLRGHGFKLVIISNQSGVARGIITRPQVEKINRYVLKNLFQRDISIDGIYYCPHHPKQGHNIYRRKCSCRKPAVGMVRNAQRKLNLSTRKNYVVGDKLTDVELAKKIRAKGILVLTGFGNEQLSRSDNGTTKPDYVARNILQAARWIIRLENRERRKPS